MPNESYVQVAPDSTGKKIRNVSAYVMQSDGSVALMQMQVVAVVDTTTGLPIDMTNPWEQTLALMRRQNDLLQMLITELTDLDPTDDVSDDQDEVLEGV